MKAGFGDAPIVAYQLGKNPDLGVRMIKSSKPLVEGELALAVRKDDAALMTKINAGIATLKANGKLKEIFGRYDLND